MGIETQRTPRLPSVLALLSTMFNKARLIGWEQANPCKGVDKYAEQSRDRFLSADELTRFFVALAEEPYADWRDFFQVALFTGASWGECALDVM